MVVYTIVVEEMEINAEHFKAWWNNKPADKKPEDEVVE